MQYGAAMLLLLASTAFADISPVNPRDVTINPPPAGELTLQAILDQIYGTGAKDAGTDQETAGIWQLPGSLTGATAPILQFEQAGNAGSNTFGIWTGHDPNGTPLMVPIFTGAAAPGTIATLSWDSGDPNTLNITGGANVNVGPHPGINRYWFGFYLQGPGGTFFTADQLNSGNAQAVVYRATNTNLWTFAFEDRAYGITDKDYNDLVVTAESIVPAPDGGVTVLLLGGALVGLEALRRKFCV
jgi:hypothetical protein